MKILGIDPAINNIGWAILEQTKTSIIHIKSGTIKTNPKDSLATRLAYISFKLEEIVELYNPDFSAIEETFVNLNPRSSIILSHARGGIMTTLGRKNLTVKEFAPNEIKKTITGSGRADKLQIMRMLKMVMPSASFSSADEADAIAIAYAGLVSNYSFL